MSNASHDVPMKHGRSAMWQIEVDLLRLICATPGDHVEIGTLWGGSAIVAAKSKPKPGRVFSIDMMLGPYWETGDPGAPGGERPTARKILANFHAAGVADRITLVCANSFPFPFPELRPTTALIDGAHDVDGVLKDWESLKTITSKYIALHDVGPKHPDLERAVAHIIAHDRDWKVLRKANSLLVMERIST